MTTYWIDLSHPMLTRKIHDPYHETMITSYKTNKKTY